MLLNDTHDEHERFAYLMNLSTERHIMQHHWLALGLTGMAILIVFLLILWPYLLGQ